jgi:hypothetical protein
MSTAIFGLPCRTFNAEALSENLAQGGGLAEPWVFDFNSRAAEGAEETGSERGLLLSKAKPLNEFVALHPFYRSAAPSELHVFLLPHPAFRQASTLGYPVSRLPTSRI